jgi:superfamily I DNA/RNA helicase/RecB family exonuclease
MPQVKVKLDFSLPDFVVEELSVDQQKILDCNASAVLIQAPAGTGKSLVLERIAIEAIKEKGVPAEDILLIAFSRQQAKQIRNRLALQLRGYPLPRITTFHSYAFGVVQQVVNQDQELEVFENIKLLSGPEQEVRLKEILVNAINDKSITWPKDLMAAVGTYDLTHQVRNLLARVRALGMDPAELSKLGELYDNPLWVQLGKFGEIYLDVLDAQNLIDYAEVVHRASLYLSQTQYLNLITPKIKMVLVDEYQDIDPAQVRLLKALFQSGAKIVCAGDENSSIYQFRGADLKAIHRFNEDFASAKIFNLKSNYRKSEDYKFEINAFHTHSLQASHIISKIRELKLEKELNWSDIAIIGRGTETLNLIYRYLIRSDIPAELDEIENPIYRDPAVNVILDVIELALLDDFSDPTHADLVVKALQSPLINYSKADLRKTIKQIRDLASQSSEAVPNSDQAILKAFLNYQLLLEVDHHAWGLRKLSALVSSVKDLIENQASTYSIIWQVYSERPLDKYLELFQVESPGTTWSSRLAQDALSGAKEAPLANRALDSILSLFDIASREDESPTSARDIASFLSELKIQQFAQETIAQKPQQQAVQLLTAHSTKGREWRAVFVIDLQEGVWPSTRLRNTLLEVERLDVSGYSRSFSRSDLITEERRLFSVAQSRAKEFLSLSCIKNDYEDKSNPSQFLYELSNGEPINEISSAPEGFISINEVIVQLRKALTDENTSEDFKKAIAIRINALTNAKDGFSNPIAENLDPSNWWGVDPPKASEVPLRDKAQPVKVSASKLQTLEDCSLKWFLDTDGGASLPRAQYMSVGSIVHALARAIVKSEVAPEVAQITKHVESIWPRVQFEAEWISAKQKSNVESMIKTLVDWHNSDRGREVVAVEQRFKLDTEIVESNDAVQINGMIDRIEVEKENPSHVHIVDLKTSKNAPTAPKTLKDPQLASYRLAVDSGALSQVLPADAVAKGAELVQLQATKNGKARILQSGEVDQSGIYQLLQKALKVVREETISASVCTSCRICSYRKICPAQSEGQSVI